MPAAIKMHQLKVQAEKKVEQYSKEAAVIVPQDQREQILRYLKRHNVMMGKTAEPTLEEVYAHIERLKSKKMVSKENIDTGVRNFILPSYHNSTHFKGAMAL